MLITKFKAWDNYC